VCPLSPAQCVHSPSCPDGGAGLCPESAEVDAALTAWRRKASDILLAVLAAGLLPVSVLVILGYSPPVAPLPKAVVIAAFLVVCAAALFRWIEYQRRVEVCLLALYVGLFVATLVNPPGPYAQIAVVTIPIYALVLLGYPGEKIGIVASGAIIVSAPLLRQLPGIMRLLGIDPAQGAEPRSVVWFRATVEAASLLALIVLLDRFHRLLLDALTRRIAAQRKMEDEIHERRRLEREIAEIGDGERRRLGQELHDGACQQFTAALLHCQVLRRRLQSGETLLEGDFQALSSLLGAGIGEARNIARGLCPLDPDPEALAPALRALTNRIQEMGTVRCDFVAEGDVPVADPAMAQHLYRIAQEAVSNAVRHAHASRIAVELRRSDSDLILLVEDDGTGLPHELPAGGIGLRSMAYRAQIMDGELTVAGVPGRGTRIACRMPLSPLRPRQHA